MKFTTQTFTEWT